MPAEWEPHEAVWISWPHNEMTFPHLSDVENACYAFIMAVHTSERVELFVPTAVIHRKVRARLREMGADLTKIVLHTSEYSDVWIRDYGPTFVVNRALGKTAMVRWNFNAWGNKYENQLRDGKMPHTMNRRLLLPMFEPGIVLEGGSIDVNGRGTVLTTRACLLNPNRNPALSADQIEENLREYLGVEKVIWLNDGVVGDDTDGHIDDIARFVGPSTVVCAYETDIADANYPALHDNYEILRQSSDQDGKPLTVIRLPMPAKVADSEERYPASYTNFYIGNTVVVVPVFNDPHDAEALRIIQETLPGTDCCGDRCPGNGRRVRDIPLRHPAAAADTISFLEKLLNDRSYRFMKKAIIISTVLIRRGGTPSGAASYPYWRYEGFNPHQKLLRISRKRKSAHHHNDAPLYRIWLAQEGFSNLWFFR